MGLWIKREDFNMKFNPDGPFYQFMNSLASFIGLNFIFLITCLPIFTIGPALTLYRYVKGSAKRRGIYFFHLLQGFQSKLQTICRCFSDPAGSGSCVSFQCLFLGRSEYRSRECADVCHVRIAPGAGTYFSVLLSADGALWKYREAVHEKLLFHCHHPSEIYTGTCRDPGGLSVFLLWISSICQSIYAAPRFFFSGILQLYVVCESLSGLWGRTGIIKIPLKSLKKEEIHCWDSFRIHVDLFFLFYNSVNFSV